MKELITAVIICLSVAITGCRGKQVLDTKVDAKKEVREEAVEVEESSHDEKEVIEIVDNDGAKDTDEIAKKIVDYYTTQYTPEGEYVIFDTENVETDESISFTLRYQASDAEQEEMIANGTGPAANIYVTTVTYNKASGELVDENGMKLH